MRAAASWARDAARTSSSTDAFAQAMSSTSPTHNATATSAARVLPKTCSAIGVSDASIPATKRGRHSPGDQVRDGGARRVNRDAGRQPPEHEQHAEPGILDDIGIPLLAGGLELRHERHPQLGATRIVEAVRHHADHRVNAVAEPERPADDGRVAAEPALPGAVAEDGNARAALAIVLRLQRAPDGRRSRRSAERTKRTPRRPESSPARLPGARGPRWWSPSRPAARIRARPAARQRNVA